MGGADTGQTAGHDLTALSDEALQQANIAIRDSIDLLGAELADLLAPEKFAPAARSATGTPTGSAAAWP